MAVLTPDPLPEVELAALARRELLLLLLNRFSHV